MQLVREGSLQAGGRVATCPGPPWVPAELGRPQRPEYLPEQPQGPGSWNSSTLVGGGITQHRLGPVTTFWDSPHLPPRAGEDLEESAQQELVSCPDPL